MSRLFSRLNIVGNINISSGVLLIRGSVKYFSQIRKRIKKIDKKIQSRRHLGWTRTCGGMPTEFESSGLTTSPHDDMNG